MIQPVGNKMLVFPLPQEDREVGGIILPGTVTMELARGRISHISPEVTTMKVDDVVIFPKGSGVGERIGREVHLWLQETEIWGTVTPDPLIQSE